MTTYVKYSTDPGASSVTGLAGGILTALRWFLVTSMGWTEVWTGTNQATFRAPDLTGRRFYLFVDDSATSYTYFRAYEQWAAGVGTNPFPTVAQQASGVRIYKSSTTDGTARAWRAAGNGKCFTFQTYATGSGLTWSPMFFGDFVSWLSGDGYNVVLSGLATGEATMANNPLYLKTITTAYIARGRDQVTKSVTSKFDDFVGATLANASSYLFGGQVTYPAPIAGGALMARIYLNSETDIRGILPGIWSHWHVSQSIADPLAGPTESPTSSFKPWTFTHSISSSMLINTTAWDNDA